MDNNSESKYDNTSESKYDNNSESKGGDDDLKAKEWMSKR